MIALQLVGVGIALISIYMTYLYYRRNEFNKKEFVVWFILWAGFMLISITPSSFQFVLETFAIYRMMDLIMIVAFIVIYIIGFNNYIAVRRMQKKLEILVREDALNFFKKEYSDKKDHEIVSHLHTSRITPSLNKI